MRSIGSLARGRQARFGCAECGQGQISSSSSLIDVVSGMRTRVLKKPFDLNEYDPAECHHRGYVVKPDALVQRGWAELRRIVE